MEGVNDHIKAFKLHHFKIKGNCSLKALKFKCLSILRRTLINEIKPPEQILGITELLVRG